MATTIAIDTHDDAYADSIEELESDKNYKPGDSFPAFEEDSISGTRAQDDINSSSADQFWSLYLDDAEKHDKRLTDSWKGDTDGILIFTSLFATTVGAFIIESYKLLQPDSSNDTVRLLELLVKAQNNGTDTSPANPLPSQTTFIPPRYAVRINVLWTLSFFLSLTCALLAILTQQWSRRYLQTVQRRTPLSRCGPHHAYFLYGLERFRLGQAVECIVALLHIAVIIFLIGLLELLFSINDEVAQTVRGFMAAGAVLYLGFSVAPLIFPDCPYRTPLTLLLSLVAKPITLLLWVSFRNVHVTWKDTVSWLLIGAYILVSPLVCVVWTIRCCVIIRGPDIFALWHRFSSWVGRLVNSSISQAKGLAREFDHEQQKQLSALIYVKLALQLVTQTLEDDHQCETFFRVLPGLLRRSPPRDVWLVDYLVEDEGLLRWLNGAFSSCRFAAKDGLMTQETRRLRLQTCFATVDHLSAYLNLHLAHRPLKPPPSLGDHVRTVVGHLAAYSRDADSSTAIQATCAATTLTIAVGVSLEPLYIGQTAESVRLVREAKEHCHTLWLGKHLSSFERFWELYALQRFVAAIIPHLEHASEDEFKMVYTSYSSIENEVLLSFNYRNHRAASNAERATMVHLLILIHARLPPKPEALVQSMQKHPIETTEKHLRRVLRLPVLHRFVWFFERMCHVSRTKVLTPHYLKLDRIQRLVEPSDIAPEIARLLYPEVQHSKDAEGIPQSMPPLSSANISADHSGSGPNMLSLKPKPGWF